jgi:hypothetical protein
MSFCTCLTGSWTWRTASRGPDAVAPAGRWSMSSAPSRFGRRSRSLVAELHRGLRAAGTDGRSTPAGVPRSPLGAGSVPDSEMALHPSGQRAFGTHVLLEVDTDGSLLTGDHQQATMRVQVIISGSVDVCRSDAGPAHRLGLRPRRLRQARSTHPGRCLSGGCSDSRADQNARPQRRLPTRAESSLRKGTRKARRQANSSVTSDYGGWAPKPSKLTVRVRFPSPARPRCHGTSFTRCRATCVRGPAVLPWLPSLRRIGASRRPGAGRSTIAHGLVGIVRRNATVDWDKKERVRASLRLRWHIRWLPRSTATRRTSRSWPSSW